MNSEKQIKFKADKRDFSIEIRNIVGETAFFVLYPCEPDAARPHNKFKEPKATKEYCLFDSFFEAKEWLRMELLQELVKISELEKRIKIQLDEVDEIEDPSKNIINGD